MISAIFKKILPHSFKRGLKRVYFSAHDFFGLRAKAFGAISPPKSSSFIFGAGDFDAIGAFYLKRFKQYGMRPDNAVLDVGCGIGRIAIPLTTYLSRQGSYEGFDCEKSGISWCQKNITPRFTNFKFTHVDLFNKEYNPRGKTASTEFRFPYPDKSFDFIFLVSVFTHMLPGDLEHYLAEIARVAKPGAISLITYYLFDESYINTREEILTFQNDHGIYRTQSDETPEAAIAYSKPFIENLYRKYGFAITTCELGKPSGNQDFIVAQRHL